MFQHARDLEFEQAAARTDQIQRQFAQRKLIEAVSARRWLIWQRLRRLYLGFRHPATPGGPKAGHLYSALRHQPGGSGARPGAALWLARRYQPVAASVMGLGEVLARCRADLSGQGRLIPNLTRSWQFFFATGLPVKVLNGSFV